MKHLSVLVLAVALCVASSRSARAQEDVLRPYIATPILYGVELGANYNMFSQTITRPFPLDDSPFNAYGDGDGISWYGTLFADYAFRKGMGVQLRLGVDQKTVGNEFSGVADCALIRPGGSIDYQQVDMTLDYTVRVTFLTLAAHFRLDVGDAAFVTLGPTFHLRLDSTYQRERGVITSDGPCEFLDESGEQIGKDVEVEQYIQSEPSSRVGLEAAIGYRFDIGDGMALAPVLRFQFMLTPFIDDRTSGDQYRRYTYRDDYPEGSIPIVLTDTELNSIQLGLSLTFR